MHVYTVRRGDSLSKIAAFFGCTLEQLLDLNPQIEDASLIFPEQPINVPDPPEEPAAFEGVEVGNEYPWFEIAKTEMDAGVEEITGPNHNPRVLEYHATTTLRAGTDEVAWCSAFVNWCIERAGFKGTKSAAAKSWLKWGQALDEPRQGCIIVFDRGTQPWQGHVGFYAGEHGTEHVYVLGGNQRNQVNISSYRKRKIVGYRWPA
jgi:uncharacterized protein (TIGR02594 family)